jgi:F-type H+-transporting ATPase subunit delta
MRQAERYGQALHALTKDLDDKRAGEAVKAFVRGLKDRRQLDLGPAVITAYEAAARKASGTVEASVTTAEPADAALKKTMQKAIEDATSRPVEIDWKEDASLVAGAVVRYGDTLIDASVKGRLRRIRSRID